jgi:hypothetical protein
MLAIVERRARPQKAERFDRPLWGLSDFVDGGMIGYHSGDAVTQESLG